MRVLVSFLCALIILSCTISVWADMEGYGIDGLEQSEQSQQQSRSQQNDQSTGASGSGMQTSYLVWTFVLACLLSFLWSFLRGTKNRRQLVAVSPEKNKPDEKDKEKKGILNNKERRLILFTSLAIGASLFAFLMLHEFSSALIWFICYGALVFSYWGVFVEVFSGSVKKNPVREHAMSGEKTRFTDVGGLDDIVKELRYIVYLYKNLQEAKERDIRPPRGVLLFGPPGCGKTLVARAAAGEIGLPFYEYNGSEVGNSYVRSGAGDIKKVFAEAVANAPCVIFIDELDSVAKKRGMDTSGEYDHTLNAFLGELDGIRQKEGILIMGATNREDMLDPAILRSGRFDLKYLITYPDFDARLSILKIHTAKKKLSSDVNLDDIARKTAGMSGADLEGVCNQASIRCHQRNLEWKEGVGFIKKTLAEVKEFFIDPNVVASEDINDSILKLMAGEEIKQKMSEAERKIIAWHEIGHAVVTAKKGFEVLEQVTLMRRQWSLGLTQTSAGDHALYAKDEILAKVAVLFGGRAAEEIFAGKDKITTGAQNDIQRAHELVRKMICEWGMGEFGPMVYHSDTSSPYGLRSHSEHTARLIDKEVGKIISVCLADAKKIIEENRELVERLANMLLEKLVLNRKDILDVLEAEKK